MIKLQDRVKYIAKKCMSDPKSYKFKWTLLSKKIGDNLTFARMDDSNGWFGYYIVTGDLTPKQIESAITFGKPEAHQIFSDEGCAIFETIEKKIISSSE